MTVVSPGCRPAVVIVWIRSDKIAVASLECISQTISVGRQALPRWSTFANQHSLFRFCRLDIAAGVAEVKQRGTRYDVMFIDPYHDYACLVGEGGRSLTERC